MWSIHNQKGARWAPVTMSCDNVLVWKNGRVALSFLFVLFLAAPRDIRCYWERVNNSYYWLAVIELWAKTLVAHNCVLENWRAVFICMEKIGNCIIRGIKGFGVSAPPRQTSLLVELLVQAHHSWMPKWQIDPNLDQPEQPCTVSRHRVITLSLFGEKTSANSRYLFKSRRTGTS